MKKLLCLLVFLCLLISSTACGISKRNTQDDIVFYYCRQNIAFNEPNSVISQETRSEISISDDLSAVIRTYLLGPEDPSLTILFPKNTALTDMQLIEDTLYITINNSCASLNEIDLVRSCACLAKTVLPLTEATRISITAEKGFAHLDDPIIFTTESIFTEDLIPQLG